MTRAMSTAEQLEIPGLESDWEIIEARRRLIEDNNRQAFLELLYHVDRRDDPGHRHHATFTGLFEKYALRLGLQLCHEAMREPGFIEAVSVTGQLDA